MISSTSGNNVWHIIDLVIMYDTSSTSGHITTMYAHHRPHHRPVVIMYGTSSTSGTNVWHIIDQWYGIMYDTSSTSGTNVWHIIDQWYVWHISTSGNNVCMVLMYIIDQW